MNYRQTTLDSLTAANNKFAVSLLMELMDESNLEVPPGDFAVAIAKMGHPFCSLYKDRTEIRRNARGRRQMEIMVERKQRRLPRQVTGSSSLRQPRFRC
jgi:hypothetical protein